MPLYRYRAITASGATVAGTGEAPNEAVLADSLRAQGHYPVSAAVVTGGSLWDAAGALLRKRGRPTGQMLTTTTQELAALLAAGLELDRALGALISLTDIAPLHASLAAVRDRVRAGMSFADALERETQAPPFYVSMVRAGEVGGALDKTVARLADYLSRAQSVRDTVTSALVYPVILLVTAGLSIMIIFTFVLPEFEPLFAESGRSLPLPTRVLMDISGFVRGYWWLLLLLGIAAFAWARDRLRRPLQRKRFDAAVLRLPGLGELLRAMEIEKFCRTLGTLAGNGVALPLALRLSGEVLSNTVLRDAVADGASSLREGESLSARLARTKVFPALTLDLIQIGEQTGKLDDMLLRQADLDEKRIKHTLERLLALLVPALTIVLGFVVAGLIASMLVAILSVNDLALQ